MKAFYIESMFGKETFYYNFINYQTHFQITNEMKLNSSKYSVAHKL